MNVILQLAVAPVPDRVQLDVEKLPGPLLEKVTMPLGVIGVPGLSSVTVTVQVVGVLTWYGPEHETEAETLRFVIVSPLLVELAAWVISPL